MNRMDDLKNMAVAEIKGLFQQYAVTEYRFVNWLEITHLVYLIPRDILSLNGTTVLLNGKNVEDLYSPEQLDALIGHLEMWLPTYKQKEEMYQLLYDNPQCLQDDGTFRFEETFFQEARCTYSTSEIRVRRNPKSARYNFLLRVYSPLFGYGDIDIWEIRQPALLQRLMDLIKSQLHAQSI